MRLPILFMVPCIATILSLPAIAAPQPDVATPQEQAVSVTPATTTTGFDNVGEPVELSYAEMEKVEGEVWPVVAQLAQQAASWSWVQLQWLYYRFGPQVASWAYSKINDPKTPASLHNNYKKFLQWYNRNKNHWDPAYPIPYA